MLAKSKPVVADVTLLPTGDWSAKENATRVEVEGFVLFLPKMCCCCGSIASLDSITIYARIRFGGAHTAIDIPYCRRCQLHYRSALQQSLGSIARVAVIALVFLGAFLTLLGDVFLVGFFLQLLVVGGALAWGLRTYFVARAEIQRGFTSACSAGETPAVSFARASPAGLRFRFCSLEYAEQCAAVNPGGTLRELIF